jgi:hypothetical protein
MNAAPSNQIALAVPIHPQRKLVPLSFCAVLFGWSSDEAVAAVECGKLAPAFNVAVRENGLRDIRVFRAALEKFQAGARAAIVNLAAVIDNALPMLGMTPIASATVKATELAFRWCLNRKTVHRLIRAGELKLVGRWSRGPGQSPRVSYASAVEFLKRRLL